jgi:hypothetical protein
MAMSDESEAANRYRLHAEELRTIAYEKNMECCRVTLIKIAGDYDRMARSLDAIDRRNSALNAKR